MPRDQNATRDQNLPRTMRPMDPRGNRVHIELRDSPHFVPRVVHSRPLPTLDTRVLLIADLDGDGADEVLILQGSKQLAFFPLREAQSVALETRNGFNSPLEGHPLMGVPSAAAALTPSSSATTAPKKGGYVAATVGADGVLREPPLSLLQQIVPSDDKQPGRRASPQAPPPSSLSLSPEQRQQRALARVYPNFFRPPPFCPPRQQHFANSSSSLTFIQLCGSPMFASGAVNNGGGGGASGSVHNSSGGGVTAASAGVAAGGGSAQPESSNVVEDFTVVNAMWLDEDRLDLPALNSGGVASATGGGGLVLVLLEGFVAFISAKELRRAIDRARGGKTAGTTVGGAPSTQQQSQQHHQKQQQQQQQQQRGAGESPGGTAPDDVASDGGNSDDGTVETATANNNSMAAPPGTSAAGGAASAAASAAAAADMHQRHQPSHHSQHHQQHHGFVSSSPCPKLVSVHFSQFDSVWETPWNCCCSALDASTGVVYAGFSHGLVLALPLGQHLYFGLPAAGAPPPPTVLDEVADSHAETGSNNSLTYAQSAAGTAAPNMNGRLSRTLSQNSLYDGAQDRQQQQQLHDAATDTISNGNTPLGKKQRQSSYSNSAPRGSAGCGGGVVIPASVHASSLTVNGAPVRIAPVSYGAVGSGSPTAASAVAAAAGGAGASGGPSLAGALEKHGVLIATRDNVVLVDAAEGFQKASFTQTLSAVHLLWALQVSCVSLEVFQASRESAAWCIVTDEGAVFLVTMDGDGNIERTEFRVTAAPSTAPPPQQPGASNAVSASAAGVLGGDVPRRAFLILDHEDELCIVIVSENGGITLCDKQRRSVHSFGSGSRCLLRASDLQTSAAVAPATVAAVRRVQSVHEVTPLSVQQQQRHQQQQLQQFATVAATAATGGGASRAGSTSASDNVVPGGLALLTSPAVPTPMRRATSSAAIPAITKIGGGIGGGLGIGVGGGGGLGLLARGAMGTRAGTELGAGGGMTAAHSTLGSDSSASTAAFPSSGLSIGSGGGALSLPEVLLVDNGAIRHLQLKLPAQLLLERRAAQVVADRVADVHRKMQTALRDAGVIAPSSSGGGANTAASSLYHQCGFPSLLALGNALVAGKNRALIEQHVRGSQQVGIGRNMQGGTSQQLLFDGDDELMHLHGENASH